MWVKGPKEIIQSHDNYPPTPGNGGEEETAQNRKSGTRGLQATSETSKDLGVIFLGNSSHMETFRGCILQ